MRYSSPNQFEPLLPQRRLEELIILARKIIEVSLQLRGMLHPITANSLSNLLREMNSYDWIRR